ncbi:MAG TPA: prolipoprotein diacylglyceryl transferase [Candidatus Nanoarchaeia archaeon]|nr:prolipoprotein diacylglyceryl transferase [Candidatus Nanoarchaeia archaeon]
MFTLNIEPVLFHLGSLEIRYYGLLYAFAFLVGYWYMRRRAKYLRWKLDVDVLFTYLIIGNLVGARLFEVLFYSPSYYFANPLKILFLWQGGLSFHGGLVGGALALWWFCKKYKHSWLELADVLVLPLAFGLFLGRIANFLNGELFGYPSSLPWAVDFGDGVFRHPTQLYESLKNLILFLLLVLLHRRLKKHAYPGYLLAVFLTAYGFFRFFLEFLKVPEQLWLGFPVGQWLSAVMVLAGMVFFLYVRKARRVVRH